MGNFKHLLGQPLLGLFNQGWRFNFKGGSKLLLIWGIFHKRKG